MAGVGPRQERLLERFSNPFSGEKKQEIFAFNKKVLFQNIFILRKMCRLLSNKSIKIPKEQKSYYIHIT